MAAVGTKSVGSGGCNNSSMTLYEFLLEAELLHYYDLLKNSLKIATVSQLKYVEEEDLLSVGMTKPEQRRLRKYFQKYFPQTYLKKIKKMILPKNKEESEANYALVDANDNRPSVRVPSKHIISADSLVINKELGVGEFGVVQQGVWTNEDGERVQVAIKCLSKQRMQNNPMDFLKEAVIMHSIDHKHIVRLYGAVLETDSLMLVTELAPLRSLLECLKEPALRQSFPIISLCEFAYQICDGMQYLESKRLIHRDLAARNILVFTKNKIKISDFGLSRALGVGKDYYQTNFNVNLKLPIAWCAPECINYLRFTSASDIWAYGVTLWEMFSYGFQPWAALTGQQILEAIDEPSCQRLEQPECCPKEYYSIMLKCWEHDPAKRPKFSEISKMLPDCKPELVQVVKENTDVLPDGSPAKSKKEYLNYKVGDIITILDKKPVSASSTSSLLSSSPASFSSISSMSFDNQISWWKGALSNGKTGLFNPSNSVAYLGQNLPAAGNNPTNGASNSLSSSFIRGILDSRSGQNSNSLYSSRRRIKPEMISRPQNDLKHTGHVGADGAFFGDISFLGDKYHQLPKQSAYKLLDDKPERSSLTRTSSDLSDKTPLIKKYSSSVVEGKSGPASEQWADSLKSSPKFLRDVLRVKNGVDSNHEYHEIGDDDGFGCLESPQFETLDFGPSLMDEVFKELEIIKPDFVSDISEQQKTINDCNTNVKNELKEIANKLAINKDTNKKKQPTVKPISAADQQTLDSAIAMAQELACRTMLEEGKVVGHSSSLDNGPNSAESPRTPTSPNKKKFSFKFKNSPKIERRNFSEQTENIPDIQSTITDAAKELYNTLIEKGEGLERSKSDVQDKRNLSSNYSTHYNSYSHDSSDAENECIEANPLRMIRSGVTVIPKVRGNKQRFTAAPQTASLARLTANVNRSALGAPPPIPNSADVMSQNLLPLPPRDRTKPQPVLKHHHRKHPLVLPHSLTSESTDNEPVMSTFKPHIPVLKQVSCPEPPASYVNSLIQKSVEEKSQSCASPKKTAPIPPPKPARSFLIEDSFELQIQNAVDQTDYTPASGAQSSVESSATNQEPYNGSKEQQSNNHHVSCEDLLDFSFDRPSMHRTWGREKGSESDEVRVMQKVLANEVQLSAEECIHILHETNWNVHNAIKCIRLRETLKMHSIFLDCNWAEMLAKFNWNVRQASNYLIATQCLPEDTTEV
ncbi:tyrosine-protein kinase PR2-like protein [Leptotrombidium deliense]|uniref:non-specific protein-tyrosine kinase n=1 Tax=Leptotrombidium deliense TaxID=299467 RepID=A0A443ST04_9ACAR|nr:tyrosine-protein kinase PR2-like protein [Leptotrombidium deliense]